MAVGKEPTKIFIYFRHRHVSHICNMHGKLMTGPFCFMLSSVTFLNDNENVQALDNIALTLIQLQPYGTILKVSIKLNPARDGLESSNSPQASPLPPL